MLRISNGKKVNKERIAFICCFCIPPVIAWLVFYVYANLSSFGMAFTDKNGALTLENFVRFWQELTTRDSEIWIALKNTFLSFAIMLVQFPFQVLVSYFIYKKVPGAGIFRFLFMLPGMIFSVALTMSLQRMLGVNGFISKWLQDALNLSYRPEILTDSRFANATVLLHMIWMAFPGDLIIWGGTFSRIPEELLEAGRMDGTNWWKEFIHIIVPVVWPTVGLKMVLLFCGIFGAGGSVFLLTQGRYGTLTLANWMYMQVYGVSGGTSSSNVFNYMSAVGMVISVIAIVMSRMIRRWSDKVFDEVEF